MTLFITDIHREIFPRTQPDGIVRGETKVTAGVEPLWL